jgi:alpha-L-arabinofuranosidase
VILTEGPKMVLTPTYHVFDMYKIHQDATLLPLYLEAETLEREGVAIPALSASASRDAAGATHLSICNLEVEGKAEVEVEVRGAPSPKGAVGSLLCAPRTDSRNDFDSPDDVAPKPYEGARLEAGKLRLSLPPMSVLVVELTR